MKQHEVRYLRTEVKRLESEMAQLAAKWLTALPDAPARLAACELAAERLVTRRIETQNAEFRRELLALQLQYAMLEHALTDAPLDALSRTCSAIFEQVHTVTHLGTNLLERTAQLHARCDLSIRLAPAIVDRFASSLLPELQSLPPLIPFSRTNTTGTGASDHTIVSNVFMCKIPVQNAYTDSGSSDLHRVFDAARVAFERILDADVVQSRVGMAVESALIHDLGNGRSYSSVTRHDGPFCGAVSTVAFAAECASDELAVVAFDFVDTDELIAAKRQVGDAERPTADVSSVYVRHELSVGFGRVINGRLTVDWVRLGIPTDSCCRSSWTQLRVSSLCSYGASL